MFVVAVIEHVAGVKDVFLLMASLLLLLLFLLFIIDSSKRFEVAQNR